MVCGRRFDSRRLHHLPRANGSPLAFFCGKAQACGGSWGFLRTTPIALRRGSGRVSLSPGGSSLLIGGGLRAKSASSPICPLTSHVVTRGPIERLDGIIPYQEEITNRGESLDRAAEITENRVRRHQSPAQRPPKQGDIEAESLLLFPWSTEAIKEETVMLRLQINVGTSAVLAALVALAPRLDAAGPNSSLPFQRTEVRWRRALTP